MSNVELARRVRLSEPACLRRVRALEDHGAIVGYGAVVDSKAMGRQFGWQCAMSSNSNTPKIRPILSMPISINQRLIAA